MMSFASSSVAGGRSPASSAFASITRMRMAGLIRDDGSFLSELSNESSRYVTVLPLNSRLGLELMVAGPCWG